MAVPALQSGVKTIAYMGSLIELPDSAEGNLVELPDSAEGLWRDLLEALREHLPARLKKVLCFAEVEDVAALAVVQVGRSRPTNDELEQWLVERPTTAEDYKAWRRDQAERLLDPKVDYVGDCERVAEYRHARTTVERRAAICEKFRQDTAGRVRYHIEALLEGRGRSAPGDVTLDGLVEEVQARLFSDAEFGKLTLSHQPAKGMSFQCYLLRKAFWLSQDGVDAFVRKPAIISLDGPVSTQSRSGGDGCSLGEMVGEPAPNDILRADETEAPATPQDLRFLQHPPSPEECADRVQLAKQILEKVLDWLQDNKAGGRRTALLFLYYKAYVEPEVLPEAVIRLIVGGQEKLWRDYLDAQEQLAQVRCEFLEVSARLESASSLRRRKFEELRCRFGQTCTDLLGLTFIEAKSMIGELEEELKALDAIREEKWACQVDYMLAHKRHASAQRAYQKSCAELRTYLEFKKPWIRSQKGMADLLGASQGGIGRELAEVRAMLRDYPEADRLLAGLESCE